MPRSRRSRDSRSRDRGHVTGARDHAIRHHGRASVQIGQLEDGWTARPGDRDASGGAQSAAHGAGGERPRESAQRAAEA
eukprot:3571758-Rhodomonas_salina.1